MPLKCAISQQTVVWRYSAWRKYEQGLTQLNTLTISKQIAVTNYWVTNLKTIIHFAFPSGCASRANITHITFKCIKLCIKHTVLWTLKSDRDAISLSSSNVADVAEGFAELETEKKIHHHCPIVINTYWLYTVYTHTTLIFVNLSFLPECYTTAYKDIYLKKMSAGICPQSVIIPLSS